MASIEQMRQRQQQQGEWAGCDPVTLVSAAREELYGEVPQNQRQNLHALEEVISRFDQLTRAAQGVNTPFTPTGGSQF